METLLFIAFATSFAGFIISGVVLYRLLSNNKKRKKTIIPVDR